MLSYIILTQILNVTCSHPSYLALSWQTAAVFAGGVTQHQTDPPPLLYTATQTTEQKHTRNHESNIKNVTNCCVHTVTYPAVAAVLGSVQSMGLHHTVHNVLLFSA